MRDRYSIARPLLGEPEAAAVRDPIMSGWVAQGPAVDQFETEFAASVNAEFACAVSSGTTALHLALLAVGVSPGDVVLTVSHSYIATANSVRHCFAEPVFVDIDPATYNMDIADLERCLAEECTRAEGGLLYSNLERIAVGASPLRYVKPPCGRVAAILAVHQMGLPCDIVAICRVAAQYQVPVVEDSACALGSEISPDGGRNWDKIGKPHADLACFSFHPRKIITTGEGGMVTASQGAFDRRLRLWRNQGMSVAAADRHDADDIQFPEYVETGYNYRLTDIQAAMGVTQLQKLDEMVANRRHLAELYKDRLRRVAWLKTADGEATTSPNWQSYPVRLAADAPLGQVELMRHLLQCRISSQRGIMNAHQEPAYALQQWCLPQSESARDNVVLLPIYYGLEEGDIAHIASVMEAV